MVNSEYVCTAFEYIHLEISATKNNCFFFSVTFFAMELFQRLGFADATLIVAVSATSLRAVGNVISGFIVIFKGTQINQNGST